MPRRRDASQKHCGPPASRYGSIKASCECALVIPVISENTQARPEGYFRLEWNLAVLDESTFRERHADPVADDDVIQQSDVHQCEGLLL
jgi:hypothetical protein